MVNDDTLASAKAGIQAGREKVDDTDALYNLGVAEGILDTLDGERYVCMPCREFHHDRLGELVVPGGTFGQVWCPWCGDAMEKYEEEIHGR